jgi:hypothetical protein
VAWPCCTAVAVAVLTVTAHTVAAPVAASLAYHTASLSVDPAGDTCWVPAAVEGSVALAAAED